MLLTALWVHASPALAQDALSLRAVRDVHHGFGSPELIVDARVDATLTGSLSCGGKRWPIDAQPKAGTSFHLKLEGLPKGRHTCTGTLEVRAADGSWGEMPLNLNVSVLDPLALEVLPDHLNLDEHTLRLSADRPVDRVTLMAYGAQGVQLGQGETTGEGQTEVSIEWQQIDGEVLKLELMVYEPTGLPTKLELWPWSYAIPHEDVVFASGSADITAGEEPKLESAWKELESTLQKYGDVVQVQLFVAGYTDTVGPPASNLELSRRRARSIAAWFRKRGFRHPVHYQGFGETVLARPTPDETPDPVNRRALYVLAAQPPPTSVHLPKSDWTRL